MPDPHVSLFSDHVCTLGEGPAWDPLAGTLFWFDIVNGTLLEQAAPGLAPRLQDIGRMASAAATIDAQRQLIFTEHGFYVRDRQSGALTLHTALEQDNAATRSNDARVHPSGAFWGGTMSKTEAKGAGAFYWFFKGELRTLWTGITVPNSICFSPDGAIAYFVDTPTGRLMRVACDPANGLPAGEPQLFATLDGSGGFDGSVVDADGTLWNARWGESRLVAFSPEGKLVRTVALPVRQGSCPAFFGPDLDRLVVTSAWAGMDEATRATDPQAGKTFILDLPVKGRPEPVVLLG